MAEAGLRLSENMMEARKDIQREGNCTLLWLGCAFLSFPNEGVIA